MSYDIWLEIDTGGKERAQVAEVGNYTSNVGEMWGRALDHARVTQRTSLRDLHGWSASKAIPILIKAVTWFEENMEEMQELNPPNGWGDARGALSYLRTLLDECRAHPKAEIRVCS